jgi:hypothetical protein
VGDEKDRGFRCDNRAFARFQGQASAAFWVHAAIAVYSYLLAVLSYKQIILVTQLMR